MQPLQRRFPSLVIPYADRFFNPAHKRFPDSNPPSPGAESTRTQFTDGITTEMISLSDR
jgi:hypothetical protein